MRPLAMVIAAAIAIVTTAPVAAKPMRESPIMRACTKPATWPALEKCLRRLGTAKVHRRTTAKTQVVTINEYERLLFVQLVDGRWRRVLQLPDAHYTVVEERAIQVGTQPALRIELRHQVSLGVGRTLTEKIALVCPGSDGCHRLVYACIVMSRGKATETFLGEVAISADAMIAVTGDRSRSGTHCTNR